MQLSNCTLAAGQANFFWYSGSLGYNHAGLLRIIARFLFKFFLKIGAMTLTVQ